MVSIVHTLIEISGCRPGVYTSVRSCRGSPVQRDRWGAVWWLMWWGRVRVILYIYPLTTTTNKLPFLSPFFISQVMAICASCKFSARESCTPAGVTSPSGQWNPWECFGIYKKYILCSPPRIVGPYSHSVIVSMKLGNGVCWWIYWLFCAPYKKRLYWNPVFYMLILIIPYAHLCELSFWLHLALLLALL